MELLQKIKEAETEAQQVVERAKTDAVAVAEEGRKKRQAAVAEAELQRNRAIESAVAAAQSQGLAEARNLKEQAAKHRRQLRQRVEGKMAAAAAKVMDYLKV